MKVDEIRELYLKFFEKKNHTRVPSDSLIPQNDPSLLFTGAGMNQFKEYFLGIKKDLKRATSSQKCLRTGDLDEVGKTPYHHSFFEMLGNFSFGDYFKNEAIHWAWEFLTRDLQISKEKLRISVHQKDEEAYTLWKESIGVRPEWIYKLGDKGNFWPSNAPKDGPNGPCGPCSEIYFDQGEDPKNPHTCHVECDCRRFTEIWNLVFTQFDRQEGGVLKPLAQKNIDTGMGLERLACVLQGKKTNFEIDTFQPINQGIERALGLKVSEKNRNHLHAISDHLRATVFALADGVLPSNEGRGYVIRKLIRRALWHARQLKGDHLEEPFLYSVVSSVVEVMKNPYPYLRDAMESISSILKGEEERFLNTLETGLRILEDKLKALREQEKNQLSGETVFELYDTYGFPLELTRQIAESRKVTLDDPTFESLMEQQRKRAKESSPIATEIFVTSVLERKLMERPFTKFLGYKDYESRSKVLYAEIKKDQGIVVLDQTPFYGESGGQVGDRGVLENAQFRAEVLDTQKKDHYALHFIRVEKGCLKTGDTVQAKIDVQRRENAMRNHTATHLLHAALRNLLGKQVRQLGSLVSPEKLRFDYSYPSALTQDQIKTIEDTVNQEILRNQPVKKEEKFIDEAKKEGAIAFFGEKYGKTVRVVTVEGFSKELCGGTHCDWTGQIGILVIASDSSIASGTRRIEALTGRGAMNYLRMMRAQLGEISQYLKTSPQDIMGRLLKLQEALKKLEKEKNQGFSTKLSEDEIVRKTKPIGKYLLTSLVLKDFQLPQLRHLSDDLRSKNKNLIYFLGSMSEGKINFLLGMSPHLKDSGLNMLELSKEISPLLQAHSGGRVDLVQGGAPNDGQLESKEQILQSTIETYLIKKTEK